MIDAIAFQELGCQQFGSPFSAALLAEMRRDFIAGGIVSDLLAPWRGQTLMALNAAAVPLRLLAALHDLVLSGEAPALATHYPHPDKAGDAAAAWTDARTLLEKRSARIAEFMAHEPQTNEVRRSICLLGGFLTIGRETGLPLRCVELGASAGLNMSWSRYAYRTDQFAWGDASSKVDLDTDWRGAAPPLAPLDVHRVLGCDRKPIDLCDPLQARRLQSYIWPDQFERLSRIRAAIETARAAEIAVETADASDFALAHGAPKKGVATVLCHSVFWQYMPPASQDRLRAIIAAHGEAATKGAPVAWLYMEPNIQPPHPMEVRLTLWPGGDERKLANVHPHGAWVEWLV